MTDVRIERDCLGEMEIPNDQYYGIQTHRMEKVSGTDVYKRQRKAVIEDLKAQGLLVGIKPHKHMVPLVPRTGEVVEPMISEQWFLAMSQPAPEGSRYPGKSLSDLGLEAVQ